MELTQLRASLCKMAASCLHTASAKLLQVRRRAEGFRYRCDVAAGLVLPGENAEITCASSQKAGCVTVGRHGLVLARALISRLSLRRYSHCCSLGGRGACAGIPACGGDARCLHFRLHLEAEKGGIAFLAHCERKGGSLRRGSRKSEWLSAQRY